MSLVTYVIYVPEENDPGESAFLEAIEKGASEDTLGMMMDGTGHINGCRHHRLGVTIRRIK